MPTPGVAFPRDTYNVGIICALATEKAAAVAILDKRHERLPPALGDVSDYTFGTIGAHRVVIACLPAGMKGKASAAVVAQDMMRSFSIRIGLMVGIAGGVWSEDVDVRLGDVIVSQPTGQHGGVVQFDFGKTEAGGSSRRTGTLNKPPRELLSALQGLQAEHLLRRPELEQHLAKMLSEYPAMEDEGFVRPGNDRDELFEADYDHESGKTCKNCDRSRVVQRDERLHHRPRVHYGNIASGDQVMKDGRTRDRIAQQEEVICFEMEAAGLMDSFPCLVIRGVCDYADSHKNKRWQPYAAATAAAYAREFLLWMPATEVAKIRPALEATVYIPLPKNHQFIGRQRALETLHQKLFTARDCQKLAVVGLGGIGKTQVVLSFAYTVMEQQRDVSIFWVPAVSAETFERAMREIAKKLGIRTAADKNEEVKEVVKAYLSGPQAGKWLLIVDNADDMHVVEKLLPYLPYSADGSVIFTTRTTAVAQQLVGSNTIELVKLQPDEANQLLTHALNRKEFLQETSVVTDFFEELDYVPLAITQAAAYLNINTNLSIAEYLRLIRGTDDDKACLLSKEIRDHTRYEQSSNAIARTWIVSFEQIQERDSEAADLLRFIACIEWKDIPHSILPPIVPEARMLEAIGTLSSYAFVSKRTDGMAYEMHRLVHLACWIWLRENGKLHDTQLRVVAHLAAIFPTAENHRNRATWRAYTPHAARVRKQHEHDGCGVEAREASQLYYNVGCCLQVDGRIKEALQWLHHSCRFRAALAEDHPDRLESQWVLALAHIANGQTKEAIHMLEQVVTIEKTSLAEDHPDRLASQYALARAYEANGQTKEAIQIIEQVITIQKKTSLAEDHPSRLVSQLELALAYRANRQTKEGIQLLEQVVTIYKETSLAEEHPSRIVSQYELALAYGANGQTKEAIYLLEQIVTIQKTSLAEDHPDRLASQYALVMAYIENGQTKEGIQLLDHIVTI